METIIIISSIALWITTIFNLLLTSTLIRSINSVSPSDSMPHHDMLAEGTQAPEFRAQALDGSEITQADYVNKERAMVFVSSNCGPCHDRMPELQELYPKAQKAGVELMIFNLENLDSTRAYVEKFQLKTPIFSAPNGVNSLYETYKVPGTPSYYVINKQGKIASAGFLDHTWQKLKAKWENGQ